MKACLQKEALLAALCAFSVVVAGWLVADGLKSFRMADRTVSVKGLAEREVEADLAVWSVSYGATGNDLAAVQADMEKQAGVIEGYLVDKGFAEAEIDRKPLQAQDLLAQAYRPDSIAQGRYVITQTVTIRTADIAKLGRAVDGMGTLVKRGLSMTNPQSPMYFYTKLNDIKPEMLAAATKNAKAAAAEFAAQADAGVGTIKTASQGVFQILPRDPVAYENEQNQRYKLVRVVSTITFYLD